MANEDPIHILVGKILGSFIVAITIFYVGKVFIAAAATYSDTISDSTGNAFAVTVFLISSAMIMIYKMTKVWNG